MAKRFEVRIATMLSAAELAIDMARAADVGALEIVGTALQLRTAARLCEQLGRAAYRASRLLSAAADAQARAER
jgi:hypothetical protein